MPVNGQVTKAYLLSRPGKSLKVESDPNGIRVTVPKEKPDPIASVVVLEIEGAKVASFLGPAADGSIHSGRNRRRDQRIAFDLRRQRSGNLGYWIDASDYAAWTFRVAKGGRLHAGTHVFGPARLGRQPNRVVRRRSEVLGNDYRDQELGRYWPLTLSPSHLKAGDVTITLKATKMPGGAVMNLRSIVLRPARRVRSPAAVYSSPPKQTKEARDARMAWWREAKFGMFIHFGLFSEAGGYWQGKPVGNMGEWMMKIAHIPVADYATAGRHVQSGQIQCRSMGGPGKIERDEIYRHHGEAPRGLRHVPHQARQVQHRRRHAFQARRDQGNVRGLRPAGNEIRRLLFAGSGLAPCRRRFVGRQDLGPGASGR